MGTDYDVVVVGAGMAGMSAALTAGRLGRRVALLSEGLPGGQLLSIDRIDGVPGHEDGVAGYDLCPITQEQCEAAGVTIIPEPAGRVVASGERWLVAGPGGDLSARGVIIASGARLARLGVPGEAAYEGRGVSNCASCDAPMLRGKSAVVAGGGDSAMQEALVVAEHAERVVMVVRDDALRGQRAYRDHIESHAGISVRLRSEIMQVVGDAGGVTGVTIRDLASGVEETLAAHALFVFTGLVPNSDFLGDLLPLDDKGYIRVDAALRTGAPGICAAGNVRACGAFRAAGVMGDGALAATTIDAYLTTGAWLAGG